jgi:hypothetical protein
MRKLANSLSNFCELRPFRYCTARATDKLGGIDSHVHVVAIDGPGMNHHLVHAGRFARQLAAALSDNPAKDLVAIRLTQTRWYLQCQTVWPPRRNGSVWLVAVRD